MRKPGKVTCHGAGRCRRGRLSSVRLCLLAPLALLGCQAGGALQSPRGLVAAAPDGPPPVSRSQKPDEPPKRGPAVSLLTSGNKQLAGSGEGEVAVRIRAQVNGQAILDDEVKEACYP